MLLFVEIVSDVLCDHGLMKRMDEKAKALGTFLICLGVNVFFSEALNTDSKLIETYFERQIEVTVNG